MTGRLLIGVFGDWVGLGGPHRVGDLTVAKARGKEVSGTIRSARSSIRHPIAGGAY